MAHAHGSTAAREVQKPVRGTQLLVEHLGAVVRCPSLVAIEIAWRWLAALPVLCLCWFELRSILAVYPLEASGIRNLDAQNPWVAAVQLGNVWNYYEPHVAAVLRWLLPLAALTWIVIS